MEEPLFVLGENDVRKDGHLNESYRNAVGFPVTKVIWYDKEKLGLICIDSVMNGKLERGSIDVDQLSDIEYEIERKNNFEDYKLVMILHHHPISHMSQDKATQSFYEKIIGAPVTNIEALEGSAILLDFVKQHSVSAILHGKGHIPQISKIGKNVSVVGCGSSIGNTSQADGSVYFSINLLSINEATHKISARLLANRKPGNGLTESKWHEIIFRGLI
jgi:3',5'-cyclic AMP phosphodiesterase CpdA